MEQKEFDDLLGELLGREESYIHDDGFTKNVLKNLPEARNFRNTSIMCFSIFASVVIIFFLDGFKLLMNLITDINIKLALSDIPLLFPFCIIMLIIGVAFLIYRAFGYDN